MSVRKATAIELAIDRLEKRLAPYSRAISVVAAVWFWGGVAVTARIVRLPDIPFLTEWMIFWTGVVVNVVWWGFLHPAIQRRRKAREASGN